MNREKEGTLGNRFLMLGFAVCISAAVILILILLLSGKEIRTSSEDSDYGIEAIYCKSTNPKDAFFDVGEDKGLHEIKITYSAENAKTITYSLTGTFDSYDDAEGTNTTLHAYFNKYLSQFSVDPSIFEPNFAAVKGDLRVRLFTDISNVSEDTGTIFFLKPSEVGKVSKGRIEEAKRIYESKDFKCELVNNNKEENERE